MKPLRVFSLPNLSATQTLEQLPWDFPHKGYPCKDKDSYRKWCSDPSTKHCFFTLAEGLTPGNRVSDSNECYKLHGIVLDYDCPVNDSEFEAGLERAYRLEHPPALASKTFSGGVRLIWFFDKPLSHTPVKVISKAVKRYVTKYLKAGKLFPGLDAVAYANVNLYYEAGTDWTEVNVEARLPISSFLYAISEATKPSDFNCGKQTIPLEIVAAEVERRFPGRWSGEFAEGARGVRFWDDTADANAVLVRESGCTCFTGDRPFVSWVEIFGKAWVEQQVADVVGQLITNVWRDRDTYYVLIDDHYVEYREQDIIRHYKVQGHSSTTPKGETCSPIDNILTRIKTTKSIDAAVPVVFCKDEIVVHGDRRFLNTLSRKKAFEYERTPEPVTWDSPLLTHTREFLSNILGPEQLPVFLAWLSRSYKACYLGRGRDLAGQAILLAGPPEAGKTFLVSAIFGRLLQSVGDASGYFLDADNFTSSLCNTGVWSLDDDRLSDRRNGHAAFTAVLKKAVANRTLNYNKKFGAKTDIPWWGRVVITCNTDSESLRILPDLEQSILDKLMMFRIPDDVDSLTRDEALKVEGELGYFANYLYHYTLPDELIGTARFGIKPFHNPELVEAAREISPTYHLSEVLESWREEHFTIPEFRNRVKWEGTAGDLLSMISDEVVYPKQARQLKQARIDNAVTFGRRLNQLISEGVFQWLTKRRSGSSRLVTIQGLNSTTTLTEV